MTPIDPAAPASYVAMHGYCIMESSYFFCSGIFDEIDGGVNDFFTCLAIPVCMIHFAFCAVPVLVRARGFVRRGCAFAPVGDFDGGTIMLGVAVSQTDEDTGRETGAGAAPRYSRRLSDKILIAFHQLIIRGTNMIQRKHA